MQPANVSLSPSLPASLSRHRVRSEAEGNDLVHGQVRFAPLKALWFLGMTLAALVGGVLFFSWSALLLFMLSTAAVLLLGHSLGSHRKLIHDSFQCPRWLEALLVWFGSQVGLAGPLGLLRPYELGHFAHNHGEMNHVVRGAAVQGRNIRWTSLLTMGECWHNNHHAFPGSARLGLMAGEWDPGWWVLCGLERVGLVWGIRLPADLPHRAELSGCAALSSHEGPH